MELADEGGRPRKKRRIHNESGPYILRTLIDNVPLTDGEASDALRISCVEFWEGNLYIGTSGGEVLHYVRIPSDPSEALSAPNFILASRVKPPFTPPASPELGQLGVQQILVLPRVNKASILCNGTVTFYSLPELTPAFGTTQVKGCNQIGGVDLNLEDVNTLEGDGELVLICLKSRIRLVRIGEEKPQPIRNIEYGGCLGAVRRGSIACVANAASYALLDVDHQQKIPLFPISSLEQPSAGTIGGQAEDISSAQPNSPGYAPTARPSAGERGGSDRGHGRSTSLGAFVGNLGRQQGSSRPDSRDRYGFDVPDSLGPERSPIRSVSPSVPTTSGNGPARNDLPPSGQRHPPVGHEEGRSRSPPQAAAVGPPLLKPRIWSPTSTEFLLVTGTATSEPGVGIFVNLDGDVCRSTLEFGRYPEAVVLDGGPKGGKSQPGTQEGDEGYIIAVSEMQEEGSLSRVLEIQRWDIDAGESAYRKDWIEVTTPSHSGDQESRLSKLPHYGIHRCHSISETPMPEVYEKLRLERLHLLRGDDFQHTPASATSSDSRTKASLERVSREIELFESHSFPGNGAAHESGDQRLPPDWEAKRNKEEEQFARRFGNLDSQIVSFAENQIWSVIRNPIVIRLDSALDSAEKRSTETDGQSVIDRQKVIEVLKGVQYQEPRTETEFLSLGYIRQKASLLLFKSLTTAASLGVTVPVEDMRVIEGALVDGGLDPRVILLNIPALCDEVVEGEGGIWLHGGVKSIASRFLAPLNVSDENLSDELLELVRRFLAAWRRKKGFGSISDEKEVFQTIDAALLRVLLKLDARADTAQSSSPSAHVELNALVDQGVDCTDRAITLLEESRRLYLLSRLYQSRRMPGQVLSTWKRILQGEQDDGGDFINGEAKMRSYLSNYISDTGLFEEYGTWLARRNPRLGIQVFADDQARVKLEPARVVELLERNAPGAVKEYLEYLVFAKKLTRYVNNLIGYYLDNVLSKIESSDSARAVLAQSYESYRALRPPRPTYRQFVTDNAIDEDWWRNRLRLLELLGGSHGAASQYDVFAVLNRIEPFERELVPEMIILDGRQARHEQALRLLTHGLGDYDTAINYCLLGGLSIFHPTLGAVPKEAIPSNEEQSKLFSHLLSEFLRIEDISDRIEQTGNLLERFGGWFDIGYVLNIIPDKWSVEIVSGFLVSAIRRMVKEKSETMIAKALSGAENLKITEKFINKCDKAGPTVESAE
ncbi:MAG: hypothetical protein M1837_000091 [Sclerophora amabilis]|nr:MAG: hypothetical protein M1837_000091 [Sclerophora amabilis]